MFSSFFLPATIGATIGVPGAILTSLKLAPLFTLGCVADTAIMKTFLLDVGFQEENIRVLTDDQVGTEWMPTRDNILQNLTWLIHDAKEGDS